MYRETHEIETSEDPLIRSAIPLTNFLCGDDETISKYVPFTYKFGYVSGALLNDQDVTRLSK
jgi:hypothetical protein